MLYLRCSSLRTSPGILPKVLFGHLSSPILELSARAYLLSTHWPAAIYRRGSSEAASGQAHSLTPPALQNLILFIIWQIVSTVEGVMIREY